MIVSGGAINSPHVLMLSGVGPADHLRAHGIDVVADLPGVGENLQDHIETYVQHACTQPITLYGATRPLGQLKVGLEWILLRKGLGHERVNDDNVAALIRRAEADLRAGVDGVRDQVAPKVACISNEVEARLAPIVAKLGLKPKAKRTPRKAAKAAKKTTRRAVRKPAKRVAKKAAR